MKRICKINKSSIIRNVKDKGESIEEMLRRLTANKQPIPENVPEIFTAKADGIIPDYDIRHDRFETAYKATDKFAASDIAKGAEKGENGENNNDTTEQPKEE